MRSLKTVLLIAAWTLGLVVLIPIGLALALFIGIMILWDLAWSKFESSAERDQRHRDASYGRY